MTDNKSMYGILNRTNEGDIVELTFLNQSDETVGGATLRIDEKVHKFGDGEGKIICRNDVDDIVHVILEDTDYTDGPLIVEEKDSRWWSRAELDFIYD